MNRQSLAYILAIVAIAMLPFLGAYPIFVMKVMCYALFACAFNLLLGFTGLLSFGHAAFLGGAAYATGHSLAVWGWSTGTGLLFGTVVAALMGLVMGGLAIRRSGIYFAMITLAMAQMAFFFFLQAPFTGGEDGLQGIPRGTILGIDLSNDLNLYYLVMAVFVFGYFVCWRTVNSPFGQVLKAIRENEPRTVSLGYNVDAFKLVAFVLSASLAGLAGAMVRAVDGNTLVLTHESAPLARRLSEQRNAAVIIEALKDALGVNWRVRCETGGPAPQPASPAAAPRQAPYAFFEGRKAGLEI